MCDSGRRRTDRQFPWLKVGPDGTQLPLSGKAPKWRVGGWVGGLCVKLKDVGMDGKSTLKMFTRKKRELIKTPSISKKSRAGSPGAQSGAQSVSSASLLLSVCLRCPRACGWGTWGGRVKRACFTVDNVHLGFCVLSERLVSFGESLPPFQTLSGSS